MTDLAALGRGIGYLGAFGLLGGTAALWLARRVGVEPIANFARRFRIGAAFLLIFGAAVRLRGQVAAFLEPGHPIDVAAMDAVLGTRWGTGWKVQLSAALAALAITPWIGRRRGGLMGWVVALAVAATVPLTGHAIEFPPSEALGVAVQGVHVAGAGLWLGTLGVLALGVVATRGGPDGAIVRERLPVLATRFSRVALTGAGLAVAAGAVLAFFDVGSVEALVRTTYGRLVLLKIGLVLGAMGLGAYNWRVTVPRLEREGDAHALNRAATSELLLALGLVVVTAILSGSEAPGLMAAE